MSVIDKRDFLPGPLLLQLEWVIAFARIQRGRFCWLICCFYSGKQTGLLRHDHLWRGMDASVVLLLMTHLFEALPRLCCAVKYLSHYLLKLSAWFISFAYYLFALRLMHVFITYLWSCFFFC